MVIDLWLKTWKVLIFAHFWLQLHNNGLYWRKIVIFEFLWTFLTRSIENLVSKLLYFSRNAQSLQNKARGAVPLKCRKMVPISNTGSVPKTVTWYWHLCVQSSIFPHCRTFTKKCFYFMIFDCYKLKLSVSKNWQLFSKFNTHQFWRQKQLKNNWAHFFEHKEHPQCANYIWQSLP